MTESGKQNQQAGIKPSEVTATGGISRERDAEVVAEIAKATQVDEPMLRWFRFDHLPEALRERSRPFSDLAHHLVRTLPRNVERSVALRKLLEAKDAAVRAAIE